MLNGPVLSFAASRTSAEFATGGGTGTLLTPVGLGVGDIVVTAVLVALLAFLNIYDLEGEAGQRIRTALLAVSIPLLAAFSGIVIYESLQVVTG